MDISIFVRDKELSEKIIMMARNSLVNGFSVDETMRIVIASDDYSEWIRMPRTHVVHFDQRSYYEELVITITWDRYISSIDTYIAEFFSGTKNDVTLESDQYDYIFEQLGMQVTAEQLGYEIAQLSKLIGTKTPINYSHLLCLFNGSTITDMNEDQFNCLLANEEETINFVENFHQKYRMN